MVYLMVQKIPTWIRKILMKNRRKKPFSYINFELKKIMKNSEMLNKL